MGREEVDTGRPASSKKVTSIAPLECNSVNADTRNISSSIYLYCRPIRHSLHRRMSNTVHYFTNRSQCSCCAWRHWSSNFNVKNFNVVVRATPLSHFAAVDLLPSDIRLRQAAAVAPELRSKFEHRDV